MKGNPVVSTSELFTKPTKEMLTSLKESFNSQASLNRTSIFFLGKKGSGRTTLLQKLTKLPNWKSYRPANVIKDSAGNSLVSAHFYNCSLQEVREYWPPR